VVGKAQTLKECLQFSSEGDGWWCSSTANGKLFDAHEVATGYAQSPNIDHLMDRTVRVVVADVHRWQPSTSANQQMLSAG